MSTLRRCAIAISWIAALSGAVAADPGDVPVGQSTFRVYAAGDGLHNLVISSIVQDGHGFLWLATEDGVYRFDGERFTHFSEPGGLLSSVVYVVGVGPDGEACVGSRGGLVCWDGTRFSGAHTQGVPPVSIPAMLSFGGRLWVGTEGAGLYTQDATGAFVPAPGWPGLQTTMITAMWADADGLVIGDGATIQLSAGDGVWRPLGDVGLGQEHIDAVLRDRQGALWIRTPAHLWLLPRGATHITDVGAGLPTHYDLVGISTGMAIGPRGRVLVATDAGIARRDGDHWSLLDHGAGMPGAATRALFVDGEGTIWIGAAGLYQLRGRGIVEHYDAASGLPGETAWTFQRDREGTLWVGTDRCLARATATGWHCLAGTENRVVRAIVFPPQGGVFVGGAPADLLYIAPDGRAISLGEREPPVDRTILALTLGPDGDLWIGTRTGLFRLPGAVPGPLVPVTIPGVPPNGRYVSVIAAGDQVWTATDEGVLVFENGQWHIFDEASGFPSSAMRRMLRRADGRTCVTYNEAIGVTCFRYAAGAVSELQHIGVADGLTTGMVYFLGEDRQQRLWIGTGDGVDVVTPQGIDHFDDSAGLAGNDSSALAFLVDRDGSLWLGATGGASHVFAQFYSGPPRAPRTAFLAGQLGGLPIVNPQETLEVPHDHGSLTLEFASSSLLDSRRVEFQVRLSPLEPDWSTTHQRTARYPALRPGHYRFEVRARVGAGEWGSATELSLTVLPAWWETWWFFVALGAVAVIAIAWLLRTVLRRRTRQLHARAEASFRTVIDGMPDLISVYRHGTLTYLNLASRRFIGLDDHADRLPRVLDHVHVDDRARVTEMFRSVRAADTASRPELIEVRMRAADGTWRICETSMMLVDVGDGPAVVTSGRDVTERKRMRAKLLVSDRMASLGTLAAGIAHEINNPLAYVAGNLEVMAESLQAAKRTALPADSDELSAVVADARDGAERVRKIVQGLRSFSRSEHDEQRAALALPGVLEAAMRLTGNEVRHHAQLVRELDPVPSVIADDGRLTQVFINLLINAAHAIPEGHSDDNRITVRTRTDPHGRAVVEIEDTGKGMPPEVQARVFDPFFTTKDIGEGTGLGLSICHGIISGLGGQISIDSAPGQGTIVRVVLPAAPESAAAAPAAGSTSEPASNGHQRPRVLLVDDEPQVAHTMERLLRKDYDVTITVTGRDALDLIAQGQRFDAIISDVMMPNMTGIELIEELQRAAPDQAQRVIFLSGGAFTAQTRERLDQLGAPQLEKPITASELRACVKQMVLEAPPLGSSDARPDARLG